MSSKLQLHIATPHAIVISGVFPTISCIGIGKLQSMLHDCCDLEIVETTNHVHCTVGLSVNTRTHQEMR